MTGPEAHHELGASGAYRWLKCRGSVAAQRGLKDETSTYAAEGTCAHELGEANLNFWKGVEGSTRAIQDWRKAAEAAGYDANEMLREVEKYTEYVKDLCGGDKKALTVEMRVEFGRAIPGGFGTADAVIIVRNARGFVVAIHIVDLKYGKGKQVFAKDNPQLSLYGFGVILGLIADGTLDEDLDVFDEIEVGLHICQPRLNHIDSDATTVEMLLAWAEEEVAPVVRGITVYEDETRVAGSHCDFCKAQATCKPKAEQHAADLETDWDDFIEDGPTAPKVDELTAEEIGKLLAHKKDVEKWFKALAAHVYAEIEGGGDVPGWKLVAGNNAQKWNTDGEALLEAFKKQRALTMDEYAPRVLLSPAQASKALPEKSKIRDLIDKKPGKPVLADSKSKKPAIPFESIEEDFDDYDDDDDL